MIWPHFPILTVKSRWKQIALLTEIESQFASKVNHVTGKEGAEAFLPNMNKALASDEAGCRILDLPPTQWHINRLYVGIPK